MSIEKKHFYTLCVGLSVYMRSLHWGGGGGVKFVYFSFINFKLGPISAIRRAPTHQDTIEQSVLRQSCLHMSSSELKSLVMIWSDSVRFVITLESLTVTYEKIASPENCPDVTAIVFKLFCFSLSLRRKGFSPVCFQIL